MVSYRFLREATGRFFQELEGYLLFKIERVQTDNGSEFLGELDEYLRKRGIEHYFSYPKSPKTNAHVERFIQTTENELWMIEGTEPTLEEMNKKLFEYLKVYNFLRPHQSLNYKTPAEKFEDYIRSYQGVHHVLNSNTVDNDERLSYIMTRQVSAGVAESADALS
ncbi:hypothetical protein JCM12825_21720 [Desulfurobacterium crinifex]